MGHELTSWGQKLDAVIHAGDAAGDGPGRSLSNWLQAEIDGEG